MNCFIFAVARDHDFYANGILVHNPGWGDFFSAVGGAVAESFVPDCEARPKGRSGKQARLRELADDPKLGKADKVVTLIG